MIIIVFFGHLFLPEEIDKEEHGAYSVKNPIAPGEYIGFEGYNKEPREWLFGLYTVRSGLLSYDEYDSPLDVDSRHFTYGFNIFVMMQVFNFINARKIDDSLNTFSGIQNSPLFIIIVVVIFILQVIIVTVGTIAFKVALFVSFTPTKPLGTRTNWMGNLYYSWTHWNDR